MQLKIPSLGKNIDHEFFSNMFKPFKHSESILPRVTAVPAVMEYTLISSQDLIYYLDANSTVPHKSGNRCSYQFSE